MTFLTEVTKDYVNSLPVYKFEGKIILISQPEALKDAIAELRCNKVVGFDTETRPCFRKGESHPVALVQLSIEDKAFLIRLRNKDVLKELIPFFSDPTITKVGISLRDDLIALKRSAFFNPQGFVDLNTMVKEVGIKNEGVRNLTAIFLGLRISKTFQTSNWDNEILSEGQMRYAATDAWVCYKIYHQLMNKSQRSVVNR